LFLPPLDPPLFLAYFWGKGERRSRSRASPIESLSK
jgi:hypothetical protein